MQTLIGGGEVVAGKEVLPAGIRRYVQVLPVAQAGTTHRLVVERKAQRLHQMRLMENGLFVDSAPEGEKQKIIDENHEIMQIWDDETGDRMTSLCIIGRHMDKDALIEALDACLTDWHRA